MGRSLHILKVQKAKHVNKHVPRILFPPPRPQQAASVNPNIPAIRDCQCLGEKNSKQGLSVAVSRKAIEVKFGFHEPILFCRCSYIAESGGLSTLYPEVCAPSDLRYR